MRSRRLLSRASITVRFTTPVFLFLALNPILAIADPEAPLSTRLQVQVAYVYQFTKFIRWPEAAFQRQPSSFRICVDASSDMLPYFFSLEGRTTGNRMIEILGNGTNDLISDCQIYVLAKWRPETAVAAAPILTVSDEEGFVERGGMIGLVVNEGSVRFDVNLPAARGAGLEISAKLLEAANLIVGKRRHEN